MRPRLELNTIKDTPAALRYAIAQTLRGDNMWGAAEEWLEYSKNFRSKNRILKEGSEYIDYMQGGILCDHWFK